MIKHFWPFLFLLSACSSPTAPMMADPAQAKLELSDMLSMSPHVKSIAIGTASFPKELGSASLTNPGPDDNFWYIVFEVTPKTQIWVAGDRHDVKGGAFQPFTVGVRIDPCKKYQRDIFRSVPKSVTGQPTLNELQNYLYAADEHLYNETDCRNGPCISGCEPPPCIGLCSPPVVCSASGSFRFPGTYVAAFPEAFIDPIYPRATAQVPVLIPVGTWNFVSTSGDNHSQKTDEYPIGFDPQKHEIYVVEFFHEGVLIATSVPTQDLPLDKDSIESPLGVMTFTQTVTSMRAVSRGITFFDENGEQPNDSIYPLTLGYSCP